MWYFIKELLTDGAPWIIAGILLMILLIVIF
jgi:hypothetical protein